MPYLGVVGTRPFDGVRTADVPDVPAPTTRRWAGAVYGRETRSDDAFGTGLAATFASTARMTTPARAVFGAMCWVLATSPMRRVRGPDLGFRFRGGEIRYLSQTIATERRAEVPLGLDFLRTSGPAPRILEVGNVLGRYGAPPREVVDRYERAPNVVNEDIVTFSPRHRYDLIVTISTLEHVGFDEPEPDPGKFRVALDRLLHELLATDGRFLATLPMGYNPSVDQFVRSDPPSGVAISCLRRTSMFNEWAELAPSAVTEADLDRPFPGASVIAVASAGRPAGGGAG